MKFNYEAYMEPQKERNISYRFNDDNGFKKYRLELDDGLIVVVNVDNREGYEETIDICYYHNGREVCLNEHSPKKYHVKIIEGDELSIGSVNLDEKHSLKELCPDDREPEF